MMEQNLIEGNMKLVHHIINKQYPTFRYDEDIIQAGMVGLCKAADTWEQSKSEFSTYACKCILNEIRKEFSSRKKHKGVLSLDYPSKTDESENTSFGDCLVGDEDVAYVDLDDFYSRLSVDEMEVLKKESQGYSTEEIAKLCGHSIQKVWKILRIIDIKRRNFYGNTD